MKDPKVADSKTAFPFARTIRERIKDAHLDLWYTRAVDLSSSDRNDDPENNQMVAEDIAFLELLATADWQQKFYLIFSKTGALDEDFNKAYQISVQALHEQLQVTHDHVCVYWKLNALAQAFKQCVKERYLALFKAQRHLNGEELIGFCKRLFGEMHPDKWQNKEQEAVRAIRFTVLQELLKELRDPKQNDEEWQQVLRFKERILAAAKDPKHANNRSIQFAASQVADITNSSPSVTRFVSKQWSRLIPGHSDLNTGHMLVTTENTVQALKAQQEMILRFVARETEHRYELTFEDFEEDRVDPLLWNVFFGRYERGEIHVDWAAAFPVYTKKEEIEEGREMRTSFRSPYPKLVEAFRWSEAHCSCPLGQIEPKLTEEERFSLAVFGSGIEFNMEYYHPEYDTGHFGSYDTDLNKSMLDDLGLRELAWQLIAEETRAYHAKTSYYQNTEHFRRQIRFIYEGIRRGGLVLDGIYKTFIQPLQACKKKLERSLIPTSIYENVPLLLSKKDKLKTKKTQQLQIVLDEVKELIHTELRFLIIKIPRALSFFTEDNLTAHKEHKQFVSNLYEKIAARIEHYTFSTKIGKHQNTIGFLLKATFGVVAAVALTSTIVGAGLLIRSRRFRLNFYSIFFATNTQKVLIKAENEILQKKKAIKKKGFDYHDFTRTKPFAPPSASLLEDLADPLNVPFSDEYPIINNKYS